MVAPTIALEAGEARRLRRICQARSAAQAKVFRARLVLRCAEPDDPTNWQVAVEFGCDPDTVSKWRRRFAAKAPGRPGRCSAERSAQVFFPLRTSTA